MKEQSRTAVARRKSFRFRLSNTWDLYFFLLLMLAYFIIFHYVPLYGLQMAFKDFKIRMGMFASPWIGLYEFRRLFSTSLLLTAID